MANTNASQSQPNAGADKSTLEKIKETLQQAKYDPAVKEALKKENQPVNPHDLSPLHNTREVGTSGADQRATEIEITQAADTDEAAVPKRKSS